MQVVNNIGINSLSRVFLLLLLLSFTWRFCLHLLFLLHRLALRSFRALQIGVHGFLTESNLSEGVDEHLAVKNEGEVSREIRQVFAGSLVNKQLEREDQVHCENHVCQSH